MTDPAPARRSPHDARDAWNPRDMTAGGPARLLPPPRQPLIDGSGRFADRGPARTGLPESATGQGRADAVASGLYGYGRSRPRLRPKVDADEADAFDAPPLPPGTRTRRRP